MNFSGNGEAMEISGNGLDMGKGSQKKDSDDVDLTASRSSFK